MKNLGSDSSEDADKYMKKIEIRHNEFLHGIKRKFRESYVRGWLDGYRKAMEEKDGQ